MEENGSQLGALLSIGYGDRPWDDFLKRLLPHKMTYLVDVRSRPYSRQPEFNRESLELLLHRIGLKYIFMGGALGGRPEDSSVYEDGKVDYERCEQRAAFQSALDRLVVAYESGHRVAIMCSELDPERCHRSKLIGEALRKRKVQLHHVIRDGSTVSQQEVIEQITGGQHALFANGFTSKGRYKPQEQSE